jgi:hypothetical protein
MIQEPGIDRSMFMGIVQERKEQLDEGNRFEIGDISRQQNKASNVLANMGRALTVTRSWPRSGLDEVLAVCQSDCNHVI